MKKMMKMSSASSAVLSPQCLAQPPEQISNRYNRPLPTGSKNPRFQNEARCTTLSCENKFYSWFPYPRLSTYPLFETEARGNWEMAYIERTV